MQNRKPELEQTQFFPMRSLGKKKAIVFVHGLFHDVTAWAAFTKLIGGDLRFDDWDYFCVGYQTTRAVELWSNKSSFSNQAGLMYESFLFSGIAKYEQVAIIAHSAGGLLVQKLLVDFDDVCQRVSHVFLFGTPSEGSQHLLWFHIWKSQWRDLTPGSRFLVELRASWRQKFSGGYPFNLEVIIGEDDIVARPASVRKPFPQTELLVVPGDHQSMIEPTSTEDAAYRIVEEGLKKPRPRKAPSVNTSGDWGRSDVFISYSHENEPWMIAFSAILAPILGPKGIGPVWDDRQIKPGIEWEPAIQAALKKANFGILLLSTPFFKSIFIRDTEVPSLLSRKAQLLGIVVDPIDTSLLEPKALKLYDSLMKLELLNDPKTSFSSMNLASAWPELEKIARKIDAQIR